MADKDIFWYVLFSQTGSESRLVNLLKNNLSEEHFLPFIPQKTCIFRRQGQKTLFQKICFPGYVFIESDKVTEDFVKYTYPVVYKLKEAYRFLCYGDRGDIAMREEERIALSRIIGKDHNINISSGFREGDSIKIISGALLGSESKILRINKNRNEAVVALGMFGTTIEVSVGLEVIEKINN